jgi:reactive intermediate/imine deaminase
LCWASLAIAACKPTTQTPADQHAGVQTPSASADTVEYLNSDAAPPGLPFSEAVRVGDLLLLSGQIGTRNGEMAVVPGGLEPEARQTMDNIRGVLERNGLGMQHVIKCTVMLADMAEWPAFNAIYREYFTAPYPARSALGANGLALGARVEVECMASRQTPGRAPVAP